MTILQSAWWLCSNLATLTGIVLAGWATYRAVVRWAGGGV